MEKDYFSMLLGETPSPAPTSSAAAQKAVSFKADRPATAYYSLFKGRPMVNVEVQGAAVLHLSCLDYARTRAAVEALTAAGQTPPKPTK